MTNTKPIVVLILLKKRLSGEMPLGSGYSSSVGVLFGLLQFCCLLIVAHFSGTILADILAAV